MIKQFFAILLTIILLTGLGGIVLAQEVQPGYLEKSGEYNFDGDITQSIHIGSEQTGAQQKIEIAGTGSLRRVDYLTVQNNTITASAITNWETSDLAKAWNNLELLSAIKLGASPSANHPTEQIFATYLKPNAGESGKLSQSFIGTSKTEDYEYIDSFDIDSESFVSQGITKRFISISGLVSEAYLSDHLKVDGYADIKETLQFYDEIVPVQLGATYWYDLF